MNSPNPHAKTIIYAKMKNQDELVQVSRGELERLQSRSEKLSRIEARFDHAYAEENESESIGLDELGEEVAIILGYL